jgi:hypothetical protein
MEKLTEQETRSLRCVAGMMIPASSAFAVPGADDELIFIDIVNSIGQDVALVRQALQRLDSLAGGMFVDRDLNARQAAAAAFQEAGGVSVTALTRVIGQCYYRDDRVMQSLGMEVRPPFPAGFQVEQGDWSLLNPVRARPAFYRRVAPNASVG